MTWLRIDDGFASHPKIAGLTDRELRIWIRTLCYCARQEDPSIDQLAIREIPGLTPKLVSKYIAVSLLDSCGTEAEIHHWVDYQPKDRTGAERQARYRARRAEPRQNNSHNPPLRERDATVTKTVTRDRDEIVTSRARAPVPSRLVTKEPEPAPNRELNKDEPGQGSAGLMTTVGDEALRTLASIKARL